MGDEVDVRVRAVNELNHGVRSYGRSVEQAVASARSDLNATGAEFQAAVANTDRRRIAARHRVDSAADELDGCREGCEPLVRALAEARAGLQLAENDHSKNLAGQRQFEQIARDTLGDLSASSSRAEQVVSRGTARLREYAEILDEYLRKK